MMASQRGFAGDSGTTDSPPIGASRRRVADFSTCTVPQFTSWDGLGLPWSWGRGGGDLRGSAPPPDDPSTPHRLVDSPSMSGASAETVRVRSELRCEGLSGGVAVSDCVGVGVDCCGYGTPDAYCPWWRRFAGCIWLRRGCRQHRKPLDLQIAGTQALETPFLVVPTRPWTSPSSRSRSHCAEPAGCRCAPSPSDGPRTAWLNGQLSSSPPA